MINKAELFNIQTFLRILDKENENEKAKFLLKDLLSVLQLVSKRGLTFE